MPPLTAEQADRLQSIERHLSMQLDQVVRCKFRCTAVTKFLSSRWEHGKSRACFAYTAKFSPVVGGSPENNAFFASTPAGELTLQTYRHDQFVPGRDYYLDLRLAPSVGGEDVAPAEVG